MRSKRRALVLVDESARHPFLRSLPPHVRHGGGASASRWRLSPGDWRRVMGTYCAGFLAVFVFIA